MIELSPRHSDGIINVLCIGAHSDDIEIGCGATIRSLVMSGRTVNIHWLVLSASGVREKEARKSAAEFTSGVSNFSIDIRSFRNGYFPSVVSDIKDCFEELKHEVTPDIIFTHYGNDLHQDHRATSELTWNTFRDHWILEYEIPKYDGGLGSPSFFVPATKAVVDFKCQTLMNCFKSQEQRQWFDQSTFNALMRLRGVECNSSSGFAEAFYVRKTIANWS